jgi:hypothetical protein
LLIPLVSTITAISSLSKWIHGRIACDTCISDVGKGDSNPCQCCQSCGPRSTTVTSWLLITTVLSPPSFYLQIIENTEGAIKNEWFRETGNIGFTRRRQTKQKHNTICVGHHYAQTNIKIVSNKDYRITITWTLNFISCYEPVFMILIRNNILLTV